MFRSNSSNTSNVVASLPIRTYPYRRSNLVSFRQLQRRFHARDGVIIPLICLALPVLFVVAALAINLSYSQLSQTQLQVATDAGVRAAGRVYADTGDLTAAYSKAQEAGDLNLVSGEQLKFSLADLETGTSIRPGELARYNFVPGSVNTNAVRLRGTRSVGSLSGPIATYFPNFLGSSHFEISTEAVASQVEVDLVLVMDRSGSMAYAASEPAVHPPVPAAAPPDWHFGDPIPNNSRWLDAVDATLGLLLRLQQTPQGEFVGLASYANDSSQDTNLTSDYLEITGALDQYSASFPGGSTNIHSGITSGRNLLINSPAARPFAAKVIILLTDGRANQGGDPEGAAAVAADEGIMTFTVTFALEADQAAMDRVAAAGKGKHFHATSRQDLLDVFAEIGRNLPNLITK